MWAVQVNVDERHSILAQLEVIFEATTHYTELFAFCSASVGLFMLKNNNLALIYFLNYSIKYIINCK